MHVVSAIRHWLWRTGVVICWAARPRIPWPVAAAITRVRIRRAQRSPRAMAYARAQMQALLAATDQADLIEAKAREYLAFDLLENEMYWNPRRLLDRRIVGIEHLKDARDLGRGVLVSFVHHAHFAGTFGALAKAGVPLGVVAADAIMGPYASPKMRQHMRNVGRAGRLVPASEGTRGFVARLKAGEVLAVASDVPGSTVVPFAGRSAGISSGAAWSAILSNAPIVFVTQDRDEDGPVVRISEPIEPKDYADATELLGVIAAHHESALLAWPEAAYHPGLCWQAPADPTSEPATDDEATGLGGAAVRQRMRLILVDQLLSGGSNVLVAMAAAHLLATSMFGLYGIVAMVYMLSVGVVRALVNDPVLVHPEAAMERRPEVVGANLALGALVGLLCAGAGALVLTVTAALGWALIILGACLPLLSLQDLGRYLGIVSQRPGRAIVLDALWLILLVPTLPLLVLTGQNTLPMFVLVWGATGAFAGLLVPVYYRNPFARTGLKWLRYTWWFSWRYLASYVATQAAALGSMVGVGAIAGEAALGGVQGSILLMRPYGLFQAAVLSSAVSEIARSDADTDSVRAHGRRVSRFAAGVAAGNALVVILLPAYFGRILLGQTWDAAHPLLWATGAQMVLVGLQTGMRASLVGRKQAQYTTAIDVVSTLYTVVAVFVGAVIAGAEGAVWGAAGAWVVSVVIWWRVLARRAAAGALEPVPAAMTESV